MEPWRIVMPQRSLSLVAFAVLALVAGGSEAFAQATRVPASLEMTPAVREANQGDTVPITIGLRNYKDQPVAAPERIDGTIESDLLSKPGRFSIAAGSASTRADVMFDRPGMVRLGAKAPGLAAAFATVAVRSGVARARWEAV